MNIQLSDVLKAIGPNAAIIFAAWIFLSFLQARYDSAINRYTAMVQAYRNSENSAARREASKTEIEVYARRCRLMSRAVTVGLASAILFLLTLIGAAVDVIFPDHPLIALMTTGAALIGLLLVITAATLVIVENIGTPNQIRKELKDLPDISGPASTGSTKLAG